MLTIQSSTYTWKYPVDADATAVGIELATLYEEHGTGITTDHVVQAARSEDSAMHHLIEWDDQKAAHGYRREQAGHIMRNLVIVTEADDSSKSDPKIIRFRALVNVRNEYGRGYVPVGIAIQQEEVRHQLLQVALRELSSFQNKYESLNELAEVFTAITETMRVYTNEVAA